MFRYKLRTLLILLAVGPPAIAWIVTRNEQAMLAMAVINLALCAWAMWKPRE